MRILSHHGRSTGAMVFLGVKKERVMERQPLRGILQLQIVELKAVTPQTLLSELFEVVDP